MPSRYAADWSDRKEDPMKVQPDKTNHTVPGKGGTPLSFSDLQIPVEALLTRDQERRSGTIVRAALARLAVLLPRHPGAYRRFLARMAQVGVGGGTMFSWIALRERMAKDLDRATAALGRAEKRVASDPDAAWKELDRGVRALETYPLDPETLYQWAREAVDPQHERRFARGPMGATPRGRKIHRLLTRVVRRLDYERDRMVLPNLRLVLKEVFRYHPTGMRRSDLFQEGIIGLQKAVFRFDPGHGTRFSTYATYWIRQAIRKSLIDKSRLIRVPQAVQEELRKDRGKLSAAETARVRRIMSETMLFSAAESDDSGDRNSFIVPDPSAAEDTEELHTTKIPGVVAGALKKLGSREREVVLRRFGLDGDPPQTLEDIGRRLNLSRERIRQIEREALTRMREHPELQEAWDVLGLSASGGPVTRN